MSKAAELAALIGSQTALSNRNLIINGAMQVAQRGTSHSQSNPNAGGFHTVDRYAYRRTGTWSGVTAVTLTQESSGAPEGFKNFLRYAPVGSDATTPSGATMKAQYKSEGLDASQLKWGTSNAEAVTLSFYVRSTVTGTFNVFIGDDDPASTRTLQVKEYTINSANTWERKTLTFSGPTSGNWPIDNGKIFELVWIISGDNAGGGSTALTSPDSWTVPTSDTPITSNQTDGVTTSSGQTWDITGIQLEVGEQATPFEHRSYADELRRCQRYYEMTGGGAPAKANSSTEFWVGLKFQVAKRANPTASMVDPNTAIRIFEFGVGDRDSDSTPSISAAYYNIHGANVRVGTFSGISAADTAITGGTPSDFSANQFAFDAEL